MANSTFGKKAQVNNNIIRIKRLFNRYAPWKVKLLVENTKRVCNYFYKKNLKRKPSRKHEKTILFYCGFHGVSGGSLAIANTANFLSEKYNVRFVTTPTSAFNLFLADGVTIISDIDFSADLFVIDEGCPNNIIRDIKTVKGKIILSCHCQRSLATGLNEARLDQSLHAADIVHFVSHYQQQTFASTVNSVVIPNSCRKINKSIYTGDAGTVGRLDDPDKNALLAASLAKEHGFSQFHMWGASKLAIDSSSVVRHSWENNKEKIYGSFDFLIFLSKHETFGLVVIEAMSAGIPCLLSDIPAFHQFRECPNIELLSLESTELGALKLDRLVENAEKHKKSMIEFWEKHYSDSAVKQKWFNLVESQIVAGKQ